MKNVLILLGIAAVILALYEQSKEKPDVIIMALAIVVAMFCFMRLGSILPSRSKNQDDGHAEGR